MRDRPLTLLAAAPAPQLGGAEAMLYRVLAAAVEAEWSVTCAAPAGPLADQLRHAAVEVLDVPPLMASSGVASAPLLAQRCLRWAAAVSRVPDVDVLVVNGLLPLLPIRLLAPRCAVVLYAHDVVVRPRKKGILKLAGPCLDLAVCVSDSVAEPLRSLGVECRVVRNAPEPARTPVRLPAERPYIVGCNAALTPWKGQDVLLDAVAALPDRSLVVEILGAAFPNRTDRAFEVRLRRRADRADLRGRVRFLGHRSDAFSIMGRWRLAVSASVEPEASGLAVLEAMSIGLPLVCTSQGGPVEVLGQAGVLMPPRDSVAMSAAIQELLTDEDHWHRASAAGPLIIAQSHTIQNQVEGFLSAVSDVAHEGAVCGRLLHVGSRHRRA